MKIKTSPLSALAHKVLLLVAALVLASCASNQSQDSEQAVEEPTVVTTPIDQAEQPETVDPTAGLEFVVYFDFDKSTLSSTTRAILDAQAAYLRANSQPVRLEGHCDERGTREYNLALGERRAKAVADYLAIQGVSRSRIEVVSYGEERPVALGSDEASWAANRRVEIK